MRTRDSVIRRRIGEMKRNGLVLNLFGLVPLIWSLVLTFLVVWAINVALADPGWYLDNATAFITKQFTLRNLLTESKMYWDRSIPFLAAAVPEGYR